MVLTLEDLKNKLEEIETSLASNQKLGDIPIQRDIFNSCENIDIDIHNYLGFNYAVIKID